MSYDWSVLIIDPQSQNPVGACDHEISFERYTIDQNDFRTLHYLGNPGINFRAPINGAASVRMWISGEEVQQDDPTYGWSLQLDPNRLDSVTNTPGSFYKIVFNNPVRLLLPLIEVSYITLRAYCLKCSATGTVNDFKAANSGSFVRVTLTPKLVQKCLKWIFTSQCAFYPTFTCVLKSYVGQKLGIQIQDTDIQTSVISALSTMQQVQGAQGTVQNLDPAEILKDIVNVTTQLDPLDPTTLQAVISVSNYAGITAPVAFTVGVGS
jgi:hypothetical protein